jgi:hypothetical protein
MQGVRGVRCPSGRDEAISERAVEEQRVLECSNWISKNGNWRIQHGRWSLRRLRPESACSRRQCVEWIIELKDVTYSLRGKDDRETNWDVAIAIRTVPDHKANTADLPQGVQVGGDATNSMS